MRAYVGQTRAAELVRELTELGIGECVVRGQLPARRPIYFYDNGAFVDFMHKRPFGIGQFMADMRALRAGGKGHRRTGRMIPLAKPQFIVLPDIVAQGPESLAESESWVAACEGIAPLYLAVQNGMREADVEKALRPSIRGLFVGGDLTWKFETAPHWTAMAHAKGLAVHVGRVGTVARVEWARRIGVDSIDSSFPLWTRDRMTEFVAALGVEHQPALWEEAS